jgi:pimeloyl-ACP methyl ester carboxylesterase
MTMPWPYLMSRLLGLLSVAILATGLWFVIDWLDADKRSRVWLVAGLLLLGAALFGRLLVLLGLRRGEPISRPRANGAETVVGAGGSQLYVESFGPLAGEVIVLTCGWGFDRSMWADVVQRLQDRFQLLVWDPPGVGRSDCPFDHHYSVERFGDDLRAVLSLAQGRPALLVGHGLGALAVLELFRRGPPRGVAGVVLLNAAAGSPIDTAGEAGLLRWLRRPLIGPLLQLDVWFSPLVRLAAVASYLNGAAHVVARTAAFGVDPSRQAVDRAAWMAAVQPPSMQARALKAAMARRGDAAEAVAAPLLVVAGGRDVLVAADACRQAAQAAPDGAFLVMEDVGHAGPLEAPAAYAAAISAHARKAFSSAAEAKVRAESPRAADQIAAIPSEPRSWSAGSGPEPAGEAGRPERLSGGGLSPPPRTN